MKQHPIQLDQEAERMAKILAEKWGLPKQRFMSRVLLRCLERVFVQEVGTEANNRFTRQKDGGEKLHVSPLIFRRRLFGG
jgi:hypothetical protein